MVRRLRLAEGQEEERGLEQILLAPLRMALVRLLLLPMGRVQVLGEYRLPYNLVYAHFDASKIGIKKQGGVWYTNL